MLSHIGFVGREFWPGAYGLGDCDEFGGVPYKAPHRSPLPNLSDRVAALTPEEILLAAEDGEVSEDDLVLGVYEADLEAALSAMESEPDLPDLEDAFSHVLKPATWEATSGLLPRLLSRGASRSHHRCWKRATRRQGQFRPRVLAA